MSASAGEIAEFLAVKVMAKMEERIQILEEKLADTLNGALGAETRCRDLESTLQRVHDFYWPPDPDILGETELMAEVHALLAAYESGKIADGEL